MVLVAGLLGLAPWIVCMSALSVMVGHAWSLWFLLKERRASEGKSVACCLGVAIGLAVLRLWSWYVVALPLAVWGMGLVGPRLLTGRWRQISPATMAATVSLPLTVWLSGGRGPCLMLAVAMALLVLVRHRNNIIRLCSGTEPCLGARVSLASAPADGTAEAAAATIEPGIGNDEGTRAP